MRGVLGATPTPLSPRRWRARIAENTTTIDRDEAQEFSFAGNRLPGAVWPAGIYRGEFRLSRASGDEARTALSADREI